MASTDLITSTLIDWQRRGLTLSSSQQALMEQAAQAAPSRSKKEDASLSDLPMPDDRHHLKVQEYLEAAPADWKRQWHDVHIDQHHWKPKKGHAGDMDEAMRTFILSSMPRFDQMCFYGPFWLYCEQARRWNEETKDIEVMDLSVDEAILFTDREIMRMRQNSLYAMNRWVHIREDTFPKGRKYVAGAPQAYICWALDRGNSIALLKGRQAAITSTVLAVICIIMLFRNNVSAVLLTDDKTKTGEDLMDKKAVATLKLLPEWITQQVAWDRLAKDLIAIDFSEGTSKGEKRANYSDMMLMSCDDTQAVNSKTPTFTLYDEAQNIPTLVEIMNEVSKTMFTEMDGELHLVRQQIYFGTGSSNDKGKGAFLKNWNLKRKGLENGEELGGWIPMFFDCTCKPGYTLEWYMKERAKAEADYRNGDKNAMAIFASACPLHWDDALVGNPNGAVDHVLIKRNRDKLTNAPSHLRPVRGKFVPIYDMDQPTKKDGNSDHKFYIKDTIFVPSRTSYDHLNDIVLMWMPPDNNWVDRYFQGTDPIQSVSGHSKFASSVYDAVGLHFEGGGECCGITEPHFHPTMACMVNGRMASLRETFSQCAMMSIHYRNHGQRACRELVELNQGHHYIEYKQYDWIDQRMSLVSHLELPALFQTKTKNPFGFHMTIDTKPRLLPVLEELSEVHGHNIRHIDYWSQLAEIELIEKDGRKMWGTRDEGLFNDDVVVSSVLAKLCADTFLYNRQPRKFGSEKAPEFRKRLVPKHVMNEMGQWVLTQVEEQRLVHYR